MIYSDDDCDDVVMENVNIYKNYNKDCWIYAADNHRDFYGGDDTKNKQLVSCSSESEEKRGKRDGGGNIKMTLIVTNKGIEGRLKSQDEVKTKNGDGREGGGGMEWERHHVSKIISCHD